ncbi:MAG: cytochrome P450 [Ktedonobacteraceae bacterium]|nr:cytochrome P450 [Ktedonobacteraceae bacterium]
MSTERKIAAHSHTDELSNRCPVDHKAYSQQKTARVVEPTDRPISCDDAGIWHVRSFDAARTILRSAQTKQAGFNAEKLTKLPSSIRPSILYLEGKPHHQQRKQTARFFAPKVVSTRYRELMEKFADGLIAKFQQRKRVDLSRLSLEQSMCVIAEVVGLTNSLLPGTARRLETFLSDADTHTGNSRIHIILRSLRAQILMAIFYLLDVKPAIKARKQAPREDVISHLIGQNAKDGEILMECITYAAAGMVTTREFISVATWHFLEHPELRIQYLSAPEEERHEILGEILRLEPVVSHIYRRATADLRIESGGKSITIPEGALMDLHTYGTNADETIVGEHALELCPGRVLHGDAIPSALMGFGDGQHRCPGSYIAIQEADIVLQRLLALDGLYIERTPTLSWNELITGYELRNFFLRLA